MVEFADAAGLDRSFIATEVLPYSTFHRAEDYHQDFYLNSAERYKNYNDNAGRKEFKEFIGEQLENTEFR